VSRDHPFRGFRHRETKEEGEHFDFAPGEVPKQSGPSIRGGHVAGDRESIGISDTGDSN
jgi:hypothetical protein